ncbi:MAG: DMT family transporter [Burkholderiaceae bacterium]|nr:DMT family transporter [Burkholderiaceae bacterium]
MSDSDSRRQSQALAAGLVMVTVWGANFSVQKYVFSAMPPGAFLFARYLLMPACALLLLLRIGGGRLPPLARADALELAKLGLIGHTLHVSMVTYGIHWSTAFSSSLILALGPVFTLLILRWRGVEVLTRAQLSGMIVSCTGVLLFLSDKLLRGRWEATGGDLVLLVAAGFFSYYTVASKPLIMRLGSLQVMGWATILGSAPIMLLSIPAAATVRWAEVPAPVWVALSWATLVSAFLGWLVWGWINAVRGVARSAPLIYLMPPVAGLIAWLTTGEQFSATKIVGAAVTLGGVALAQYSSPPGRPVREAPAPVD